MTLRFAAALLGLALVAPAGADELMKPDLAVLKAAGRATDGPALLAFLKKHAVSDETRAAVAALIEQLGSDGYAVREKATAGLAELGPAARPQVAQALSHPDLEVRKRARLV